jgi:hypothetical protein
VTQTSKESRHRAGIPSCEALPNPHHIPYNASGIPQVKSPGSKKEMSRRTTTIEEEFDDDTDLPLPNRALPNTGTRGAILEQIGFDSDRQAGEYNADEDDDPDFMDLANAQPFAAGSASRQQGPNSFGDRSTVTDIKPYKS